MNRPPRDGGPEIFDTMYALISMPSGRFKTMAAAVLTACAFGLSPLGAQTTAEKDVLKYTNLARTKPKAFAEILKNRLKYYNGTLLRVPGKIPIRTHEGPKAVREAIAYLQKVKPVGPLKYSAIVSKAGRDHVADQSLTGAIGHTGADGSSSFDRLSRYGKARTSGENISYGYPDGLSIVIQLIVDDGVPDRSHRDNIFHGPFTTAGISVGTHKTYRNMCVIVYAGGFTPRKK